MGVCKEIERWLSSRNNSVCSMISYLFDMTVDTFKVTPLFGPVRNRCFTIQFHFHPFGGNFLGKCLPLTQVKKISTSYSKHL